MSAIPGAVRISYSEGLSLAIRYRTELQEVFKAPVTIVGSVGYGELNPGRAPADVGDIDFAIDFSTLGLSMSHQQAIAFLASYVQVRGGKAMPGIRTFSYAGAPGPVQFDLILSCNLRWAAAFSLGGPGAVNRNIDLQAVARRTRPYGRPGYRFSLSVTDGLFMKPLDGRPERVLTTTDPDAVSDLLLAGNPIDVPPSVVEDPRVTPTETDAKLPRRKRLWEIN